MLQKLAAKEDPPQHTVISEITGPSFEPQRPPRVTTTWKKFGFPPKTFHPLLMPHG